MFANNLVIKNINHLSHQNSSSPLRENNVSHTLSRCLHKVDVLSTLMLSMWHHQCEPGSFIRTIQVWQVDALPEPVVCSLNASAQYQES